MRMVVVFPAPLGPRKPYTSPRRTLRFRLSTASTPVRYRLLRPWVSTTVSMATSLRLFSPQSCADGRPWPSSARPAVSDLRHHCGAGALPFRLSRVHQCPSMLLGLGPPHQVRSVAAAGCLSALFVRVPVRRLF